ncbi:hypothetical protein IV102_19850 [bacterium]|nr:hypothetical protein [bacterium]
MSQQILQKYLGSLRQHFAQADRRAAHRACAPLLREMARDPKVLPAIICQNLATPGYLERTRINPVLAMSIDKNSEFEFIMHGWLPLPDRCTETSHQSIHHHGNLLLTSVSPLGPGYDSILFESDFRIDKRTQLTDLKPARYYHNSLYNLEFVDTQTPHIVFYPPSLSITYALWCPEKRSVARGLKNSKWVSKYKQQAKSVLNALGLARAVGLNVVEYFDFYLEKGQILAMKERVTYPEGSHENFVQNLFHFLQQVGFEDYDFVKSLPATTPAVAHWKAVFLKQEPIEDRFEPGHLGIAKINLSKAEMLGHFALSRLQPA